MGPALFGFKLCVGHRWELLALCKAMLESGICPDFIVVDGKEGGTAAAPVEFTDHLGTPAREGLLLAINALVGSGIRDRIKLGVSGKVISGFGMAAAMAVGADWCNSARGFMFALGCLQSQKCHTNRCPVGVATQDPTRQRALSVQHKARRVASYHRHTVAAAGADGPAELRPEHVFRRVDSPSTMTLRDAYEWLAPRQLIEGGASAGWAADWQRASPASFSPQGI